MDLFDVDLYDVDLSEEGEDMIRIMSQWEGYIKKLFPTFPRKGFWVF